MNRVTKMKRAGTKICALLLSLAMLCTMQNTMVFAGTAGTYGSQTEADAELEKAKSDAKKELEGYQADQKESCAAYDQILWDGTVLAAKTEIDSAQSKESVQTNVDNAKARIDQIISGAYKNTLEAEGSYNKSVRYAKRDLALAEMREYEAKFDKNNYFESDWTRFEMLVTAAHSNIDTIAKSKRVATVAEAIQQIDITVESAKKNLAAVPDKTDPTAIKKEEARNKIQEYKDAAIAELNNNYTSKLDNYPNKMQRQELETQINKAIAEINRVELMDGDNIPLGTTLDLTQYEQRIQRILLSAKDTLDNRMSLYDSANLVPFKTKARKELDNYKNPKNYREAQKKELEKAIADGKKAINNAKTKEEIEKALKDAKAKIDKIKTNAQLKKEEANKNTPEAKVSPKKTSISGKIKAQKRGFTVKWKKQTKDVGGYEISYSTNSKFTKKTTVTKRAGKTATKLTLRKLKAKKKYYVRVRTYKTVKGKKYVSAWSSVKTVVTKK